ncbi:MAG: hypothetical protein HYY15_04410 [Candidatus Omnitrophica bacterium]|nr:hypothetical protein [Candidatus Omnitrophota bacterium]
MPRERLCIRHLLAAGMAVLVVASATGCGSRKSALLLERQARGPIEEEGAVAQQTAWLLDPVMQTKTQDDIEITVQHAIPAYLHQLFNNKQLFGSFAGLNPYFPEQIVFYLKLANHSGKIVRIDPVQFLLLDDRGNQYQALSGDYSTALAEARAPVGTLTRGVLEDARPGYFGVGVPVGKILGKPQQRFALLQMATFQGGRLYDGVTYDGLISFWSPHQDAKRLRLVLTGLKTDLNANDVPQRSMDVVFEFAARH